MNRLHNFVLNTICISNQHWSSFSEIELHASPHRLSTLDANSPHTSRWLAMLTSCCYPAMSANHWYLELGWFKSRLISTDLIVSCERKQAKTSRNKSGKDKRTGSRPSPTALAKSPASMNLKYNKKNEVLASWLVQRKRGGEFRYKVYWEMFQTIDCFLAS